MLISDPGTLVVHSNLDSMSTPARPLDRNTARTRRRIVHVHVHVHMDHSHLGSFVDDKHHRLDMHKRMQKKRL